MVQSKTGMLLNMMDRLGGSRTSRDSTGSMSEESMDSEDESEEEEGDDTNLQLVTVQRQSSDGLDVPTQRAAAQSPKKAVSPAPETDHPRKRSSSSSSSGGDESDDGSGASEERDNVGNLVNDCIEELGENPDADDRGRGGRVSFGHSTTVIQFSAHMYFCTEEELSVKVEVLRLGNVMKETSVCYRTVDGTAKAGTTYITTSGTLAFSPGECAKQITVPLIDNDRWDTTLEFSVELLDEGLNGGVLGRYLSQTRVKVSDEDAFPTNRYKAQIEAKRTKEIHNHLLVEYWKLNFFGNPVVRSGSIKTVLVDLLHNLKFLLRLFINVYLVDNVLALGSFEDGAGDISAGDSGCGGSYRLRRLLVSGAAWTSASIKLWMITAAMVLPFAALHVLDYKKASWKVGGASRMTLQSSLLRRFLHYDEASRCEIKGSDLFLAITTDATDIVHVGYMSVFKLLRSLGQLIMMLIFQVVAPFAFGTPFSYLLFLPFAFPVFLTVFLECRRKRTVFYINEQHMARKHLLHHVEHTVFNYRIIADYDRRSSFCERFETLIKRYNKRYIEASEVVTNNEYFAPWLSTLLVSGYIIFGGMAVLNDMATADEDSGSVNAVSMGMFLANMSIIKRNGDAWGNICATLVEMQKVLPALDRLVTYMNLPTDIKDRLILHRKHGADTTRFREALRRRISVSAVPTESLAAGAGKKKAQGAPNGTMPGDQALPLDQLPIRLKDITFAYPIKSIKDYRYSMANRKSNNVGKNDSITNQENIEYHPGMNYNLSGDLCIQQGSFAALVGPRGEGKTTLLKILGGVILPNPEQGLLFIPSHLRVLHVSPEAIFFRGSLLENLTFGVSPGDQDAATPRVLQILQDLGAQADLLAYVVAGDVLQWNEVFSQTQKQLFSLARALIANPEVLCVHKPTAVLNEVDSRRVFEVLRDFVVEKGLCEDPSTWSMRRPRTCIVTCSRLYGIHIVDRIYHVSRAFGIRKVNEDEVSESMLA
eukprot:TRINITY_DN1611_c0_g2_i1.p1 TRINITY_DN1611_c0_g2~~TRINITY_DN1611_c0_g2_i1.p1  ORF type:complete len:1123 (-),score=239.49 TRINITY_DN1611_c0_g2_i1:90-3059(-)